MKHALLILLLMLWAIPAHAIDVYLVEYGPTFKVCADINCVLNYVRLVNDPPEVWLISCRKDGVSMDCMIDEQEIVNVKDMRPK